jgi:hypothetical protein
LYLTAVLLTWASVDERGGAPVLRGNGIAVARDPVARKTSLRDAGFGLLVSQKGLLRKAPDRNKASGTASLFRSVP